MLWSLFNHHQKTTEAFYYALNNTPGLIGPPLEKPLDNVVDYYEQWLEKDGHPFWSQFENVKSWWAIRNLPNVLLVHFSDLKRDLEGETARIAKFIDIQPDKDTWPLILEHCSFDYMKAHAELLAPLGGVLWEGGAKSFIHKGTNGRWRETLTSEQSERYVQKAKNVLGEECSGWLILGNHS